MPTKEWLRKQVHKRRYESVKSEVLAKVKLAYSSTSSAKKKACREAYSVNPSPKKAASRKSYGTDPSKKKAASREAYAIDPSKKKAASREAYAIDPSKKKAASRKTSREAYAIDPSKKKAASKKASELRYQANALIKRAASILYYGKKRFQKLASSKNYYTANKELVCFMRRSRYALGEPKGNLKLAYIKQLQRKLLDEHRVKTKLCKCFARLHKKLQGICQPVLCLTLHVE